MERIKVKKLLLVALIGAGLASCNPRPPVLKSPCVAATSINGEVGDNPCIRRPVNLNLFKL
jgi:hypothetical protein